MKKLIITLFTLILVASKVWADGAEVTLIEGNTVIPVHNVSVQMVSEDVRMSSEFEERKVPHPFLPLISETRKVYKGEKVNATMNFQNNTNDDISMKMGFPISTLSTDSAYYLKSFKVFINNQPANYNKQSIGNRKDAALTDRNGAPLYREMFVWDMQFLRNEKKVVRVEYIVQWGTKIQGNPIEYFEYVVRTGALWSGKIEKADFHVHVGGHILNDTKGDNPRYKLEIKPRGYVVNGDYLEWHFANWEPTEDISIAVHEIER